MKYRRTLAIILALAVLISVVPAAYAADSNGKVTYYVDSKNGSDKNSGRTSSEPLKTLKKAFSKNIKAGCTIKVKRGGTYTAGAKSANAWIKNSGTKSKPITLCAYGKGKDPVIKTSKDENILVISGSYVTVKDIDFTAPNGAGIIVAALNKKDISHIKIDNCEFYNIYNKPMKASDTERCALSLTTDKTARIHDCSFTNLDIHDCAYGIVTSGITYEFAKGIYKSPAKSYHYNISFDELYVHDVQCGGLILGGMYKTTVRNSRFINAAQNVPFAAAAVWTHGCDHVTIEYCEIAGSTNTIDGMAIDFDGWTTNSTYRYIYSHDNTRFMRNCVYDGTTKNACCKVDHCLSVNDNVMPNIAALPLANAGTLKVTGLNVGLVMDKFKFTNNILINCLPFYFGNLTNAKIMNNTFVGKSDCTTISSVPLSVLSGTFTGKIENNTYCRYTPIANGKGNKVVKKAITAEKAYKQLFPNGVHTA